MKNKLRQLSVEKRKNLNCEELSKKIIKNLVSMKEYKQSENIICYYPLKYEVDTRLCLCDSEKNWYLPRVKGNLLEICPYRDLSKGSFGILEPQCAAISDFSNINMIIIPACAADKAGYRIGWGKGYYDRFLPLFDKNCKKIILIYSCLIYETIYPSKYDVKADFIVSDEGILKI